MGSFQRYTFFQIARGIIVLMVGLILIAILTQGLSQLSLLIENRSDVIRFIYVILLYSPQLVGLVLPIAVFLATIQIFNRMLLDNEFVIAHAAGMSVYQIASPALRLAAIAALIHLAFNLFVQPWSFRELRDQIYEARANLASSLIHEGDFTLPSPGFTFYCRSADSNGNLAGIMIDDARSPGSITTYLADRGKLVTIGGKPTLVFFDGSVLVNRSDEPLQSLAFQQYNFDLSQFLPDDLDVIYKASDRYLFQLLKPDLRNFYDRQNQNKFLAEGHARLAGPLLNFALAAIAIWAMFGAEFSRGGYFTRIAIGTILAVACRLFAFVMQQAAQDSPELNFTQYCLPLGVIAITGLAFAPRPSTKRHTMLARSRGSVA